MACSRGCCPDQKTHYRSLQWSGQQPRVREGRDPDGNRFKSVTDDNNTTITQRAGDRQDVTVRPDPTNVKLLINSEVT